MKYILTSFFLIFTLFSFGQSTSKSPLYKLNLKEALISHITIANYCGPMDSCQMITHQMTVTMSEGLVERLNKYESMGPCEFSNLYWLNIYFTDNTTNTYITNGSLLADVNEGDDYPLYTTRIEADDLCLKIRDPDYIGNLWIELEKD